MDMHSDDTLGRIAAILDELDEVAVTPSALSHPDYERLHGLEDDAAHGIASAVAALLVALPSDQRTPRATRLASLAGRLCRHLDTDRPRWYA